MYPFRALDPRAKREDDRRERERKKRLNYNKIKKIVDF